MKILNHNLTLSDLSDISTTLGVIISTLTLYSAYRLYKSGKRDEYTKNIRNILISYQYNSINLNNLLSYDITHEIVSNVIYSKNLDRTLSKIFNKYFLINNTISLEELENNIDEDFPPITISIHTELLSQYNFLLRQNSEQASKIYTDYPCLYRVYESVNFIFSQTINLSKHIARDEKIFIDVITEMKSNNETFESIDDFKEQFYMGFMHLIGQKHQESDQHDINDVLSLLDLTTNAYMRLNDSYLFKQRVKESKIDYKDFDKTDSIFEDLIEAEKGLITIANNQEILKFRELSTKIKVRNEE
nr:hypothetical protein [uncultured Fluviicola sp.]